MSMGTWPRAHVIRRLRRCRIVSNETNKALFDGGALLGVEAFAFGTIAVHGLVVTKTSHRVTPFFILNALEFFVFRTAEFAFLTPELYI